MEERHSYKGQCSEVHGPLRGEWRIASEQRRRDLSRIPVADTDGHDIVEAADLERFGPIAGVRCWRVVRPLASVSCRIQHAREGEMLGLPALAIFPPQTTDAKWLKTHRQGVD